MEIISNSSSWTKCHQKIKTNNFHQRTLDRRLFHLSWRHSVTQPLFHRHSRLYLRAHSHWWKWMRNVICFIRKLYWTFTLNHYFLTFDPNAYHTNVNWPISSWWGGIVRWIWIIRCWIWKRKQSSFFIILV